MLKFNVNAKLKLKWEKIHTLCFLNVSINIIKTLIKIYVIVGSEIICKFTIMKFFLKSIFRKRKKCEQFFLKKTKWRNPTTTCHNGCRDKANCTYVELGPVGGVPSVEGLSKGTYLHEFRRKPRKTPNG